MKNDIQINQSALLKNIGVVAKKIGLKKENLEIYGNHKAKIINVQGERKAKLILVTAINPTKFGEGKTTVSIGLSDAMNKLGHKTIPVLREPSLGPVFGTKGGATGGGYSQVAPLDDINFHFTGDMHAISSANNLIAAAIDNSIYWGNKLDIEKVAWKRCIDMNDRSLRNIKTSIRKDEEVSTSFQITAASEVMAVFCLAKDINDLKVRINNMIIGYTKKDKAIFVKDLEIAGSVVALLKDAFKPNLVQTLENNPAIIHGGPFANIAHGCNSIVATDMASKLAEYVVTEAGFGADLGMEKFLNIKSVQGNFNPNVIVIVATIRGLKAQGSWSEGLELLEKHIENINNFNVNYVIALNSFDTDSKKELEQFKTWANDKNYPFAITNTWVLGSVGGKELAKAVISKCSNKKVVNTYSANDSITSKISKIAKSIYGASNVKYSAKVLETLKIIEKNKLNKLQICIAKTPTSITDNPLALGLPKIWTLTVTDISISNGAWFIVANCGDVMTMPGLSKNPNAKDISFDGKKITGLK